MVLDFLLGWTLLLPPWLGIFCIATIVSFIMTIIYKLVTDQSLMKDLKTELKDIQKLMKEQKNNPQKMMKTQSRAMEINMKYMMHSFRPMFFSIIPIIFIFGWLLSNYSFVGLGPSQDVTVTVLFDEHIQQGNVTLESELLEGGEPETKPVSDGAAFLLKTPPDPGTYPVKVTYGQESYTLQAEVTRDRSGYGVSVIGPQKKFMGIFSMGPKANTLDKESPFRSITLDLPKLHPLGPFSLFGWMPQAFGTYVIFSIIMSLVLRRLMKVY